MATSLRELIVSVSADTTKYQAEMARASRMGGQYFKTVQDGGSNATRSWNTQTAAARTHATAIEANAQALTRYASVALSAFGASKLIGLADDWGQISSRIRMVTADSAEFESVQNRLVDIASRTYRSYNEAADQFANTANSMREMGFTSDQSLDSAEALSLALVAGASNTQRGAAANDAWSKSMVQGRITTEQFQTLLLQTPRVIQALGDGLGKTTAELQKMAKDGQLTANVVVPAITSQIAKLSAEVESMPTTVQDAGIRFTNELQRWVGEANDAHGATQVLVKGIELLAGNIDMLATVGGAAAVGALAGKMVQLGQAAVGSAVGAVRSRVAIVAETVAIRDATAVGLAKAQADLRRAQAAMGATRGSAASAAASRNLAAALLTERQAALAATQAQVAYTRATNVSAAAGRAALGLLGGPAGLAITVGMVAAGWLLFRDNTDAAAGALDNWSGSADEAVAKFRELNKEQQVGAILRLEDQISDAAGELESSFNRIISAANSFGGEAARGFTPAVQTIIADFKAGGIGADEFSSRLSGAVDEMLEGSPAAASVGRELKGMISAAATSAVEIENGRDRLASFNTESSTAATQANSTAGALRGQAGAFVELGDEAKKATDRMQSALLSLPGQIARVGKGAGAIAKLDVGDWFQSLSGDGVNFADRENPQVKEYMQQARDYIRLQSELDEAQKRFSASTKARKAAAVEKAGDEDLYLEQLNEQYGNLIIGQERQIALFGDTGRAAAMAYDLANGALSALVGAQKEALQEQAAWLDWMEDVAAIESVWSDVAREHSDTALARSKGTADQMSVYADQAARNMQTTFADYLFDPMADGFDGMVDGFAEAIRRMLAEAAAAKFFEMLGGAMSAYGGQGTWGNIIRGTGAAMTKGGKAGGGEVRPNSAYDVTEHGPELLQYGGRQVLMMGAQGGVVSPLMQMSGGGAGAGNAAPVAVTVNIHKNADEDRVETAQRPGGMNIEVFVKGAVEKMIGNGGLDRVAGQAWGVRRQGVRGG